MKIFKAAYEDLVYRQEECQYSWLYKELKECIGGPWAKLVFCEPERCTKRQLLAKGIRVSDKGILLTVGMDWGI